MRNDNIAIRIGIKSNIFSKGYADIDISKDCLDTYGRLLHTKKFKLVPYDFTLLSDFDTVKNVNSWELKSEKYSLIYKDNKFIAIEFRYDKFTKHDKEVVSILYEKGVVNITEYFSTLAFLNQEEFCVISILQEYGLYGFTIKDKLLWVGVDKQYMDELAKGQSILYNLERTGKQ